jgi:hypothetical protein
MMVSARLLFAFLAINLAALTPIVPDHGAPIVEQKHSCCADTNVKGGVHCPINSGSTTSSMATCCTGPAVCLCLYFGNINPFCAKTQLSGAISLSSVFVPTRTERPPVPPPRIAFC